ncbi:MAG: STAS domain-containing protein [Planctomycetaceae bacterium]
MSTTLTAQLNENVLVATIDGKIDGQTVTGLQARILETIATAQAAVLEVSKVGYMSSAGFRMLLLAHRTMAAKGGRLALVGLSDDVRETMEMTGFLPFFLLADSLSQAMEQMTDESASRATAG